MNIVGSMIVVIVARIIICILEFREIIYRQRATTIRTYLGAAQTRSAYVCAGVLPTGKTMSYMYEISERFWFCPFVLADGATCIQRDYALHAHFIVL